MAATIQPSVRRLCVYNLNQKGWWFWRMMDSWTADRSLLPCQTWTDRSTALSLNQRLGVGSSSGRRSGALTSSVPDAAALRSKQPPQGGNVPNGSAQDANDGRRSSLLQQRAKLVEQLQIMDKLLEAIPPDDSHEDQFSHTAVPPRSAAGRQMSEDPEERPSPAESPHQDDSCYDSEDAGPQSEVTVASSVSDGNGCSRPPSPAGPPRKRTRDPSGEGESGTPPPGDVCQTSPEEPPETAVLPVSKTKAKRVYGRRNYCLFCSKPVCKMARHLERVHSDRAEVAVTFQYPIFSKERQKIWNKLTNEGNFAHNKDVLRTGRGQLAVRKRPAKTLRAEDFVHCVYCHGLYGKRALHRHLSRCPHRAEADGGQGEESGRGRRRSVISRCVLLTVDFSDPGISESVRSVLSEMVYDEVTRVVMSNRLILQFGEQMLTEHSGGKHGYVRQNLRQVARLLLEAQRTTPMQSLEDFFCPSNFPHVVSAVNALAGFDPGSRAYGAPSLAVKLGYSLQKICGIVEQNATETGDGEAAENARGFLSVYQQEWNRLVSSEALTGLREMKREKERRAPLARDVRLLLLHLEAVQQQAEQQLRESLSAQSQSLSAQSQSLSAQSQSLSAQSLSAQSLSAQSLSAQSLSAQSLSTQSLSAQSLSAQSQSLSAQSLGAQSLGAQSLGAQSLSAQSLSAQSQSLSAQSLSAQSQSLGAQSLSAQSQSLSAQSQSLSAQSLSAQSLGAQSLSAQSLSAQRYAALARVALARVILFNRRRSKEVASIPVEAFTSRKQPQADALEDLDPSVSGLERTLCGFFPRVEVRGSSGRMLPVLLRPCLESSLELLVGSRAACGVSRGNPFVFGRPGAPSAYSGSACVQMFVSQCGAERPAGLTAVSIRRHHAAAAQLLQLDEGEAARIFGPDHQIHVLRQDAMCDDAHAQSLVRLKLEEGQHGSYGETAQTSDSLRKRDSHHRAKLKWEEEEVRAVERHLMRLIREGRVPQKSDCVRCLEAEPRALRTRSWRGIKDYVRNRITTLQRQEGSLRKPSNCSKRQEEPRQRTESSKVKLKWEEEEVRAVERHLMSYIEEQEVPPKSDCVRCLEAEPRALRTRSWRGIKDYVRNRITTLQRQEGSLRKPSTGSKRQEEPRQRTDSTRAKLKWDPEEVRAVEGHLAGFIREGRVPQKSDCVRCLEAEPRALRTRSWRGIKDYVRNRITTLQRQRGSASKSCSPEEQPQSARTYQQL
ncbi:uncharacterized protein ACNS7B_010867 isoform 2-T2 [Menidia menidia]